MSVPMLNNYKQSITYVNDGYATSVGVAGGRAGQKWQLPSAPRLLWHIFMILKPMILFLKLKIQVPSAGT